MEHQNNGIKAWLPNDRPREKLNTHGRQSLSDAELIGLLFGTGHGKKTAVDIARELLAAFQGDLNKLGTATIKEIMRVPGIGPAKASTLHAALELGRRRKNLVNSKDAAIIKSSNDVYEHFRHYFEDVPHEEFRVALLNRANRVIHLALISVGGITATVADPRKILKHMVEQQASSIVLMHNHPSGQLEPSKSDVELTERIQLLAQHLDASVLDHVIFTNKGYFSFADNGLI